MTLTTVIRPDVKQDGTPCYVAEHPELPGCFGYGDTDVEAEASLVRATAAYLDTMPEKQARPTIESGVKMVFWKMSAVGHPAASGAQPAFMPPFVNA